MKLVTLCSGGLDSTTLAYHLKSQEHEQVLLFVNYGQKHVREYNSAYWCGWNLKVPLHYVTITGGGIFKSALTSPDLEIPLGEYASENLAITVVPNRNSIMSNLAAALAVSLDYDGIALAVHAGDREVYPDCSPRFTILLADCLREGIGKKDFKVLAPFVNHSKAQIVALGAELGVPFEKTWSCYKGGELHCGVCSTCLERKGAFRDAGVSDPTEYEQ